MVCIEIWLCLMYVGDFYGEVMLNMVNLFICQFQINCMYFQEVGFIVW